MMYAQKVILHCLLFLLGAIFFADAQVLIKSLPEKDKILVGEDLRVTIEARMPLGQKYNWFKPDSIPHFEWVDQGKPEEKDGVDGKIVQQTLTISSYDTGYWTLPKFSIKVAGRTYSTDTVGIRVDYDAGFDPSQEYRDIKEAEAVELPASFDKRWWILSAASLVILAIMIYLWRRGRKKMPANQNIPTLSAYDEALQALNELRKQQSDTALSKTFYTKLNDIFRNYLSRQLQVSSFEKTNDDIIGQLKQFSMPPDAFNRMAQALRMSDFVKFAKYQPSLADNEECLAAIESAIKTLYKPISQTQ